MAWTTPKTDWEVGELVSPGDLNAVGENLVALKEGLAAAAYTTTEAISLPNDGTFEDVDSNNLNLTITTTGRDVLVHFHGSQTDGHCTFDIEVDGVRHGGTDDGILRTGWNRNPIVSFTRLIQNLSAGSHTFKLQARYGTTLRIGAQFWVREI